MFRTSAVAGLALGALALFAPAHALDATAKIGTMTCHVSSGWGFVFGSTRDLRCVFTGNGRTENYTGKISGDSIEFTAEMEGGGGGRGPQKYTAKKQ